MWHSRPGWGSLVRLMYRRNLPHIQVDDTPHFVTFRTHKDFVLPLAFTIASGDPSLDKTSLSRCPAGIGFGTAGQNLISILRFLRSATYLKGFIPDKGGNFGLVVPR
jgi:hypothetical protein